MRLVAVSRRYDGQRSRARPYDGHRSGCTTATAPAVRRVRHSAAAAGCPGRRRPPGRGGTAPTARPRMYVPAVRRTRAGVPPERTRGRGWRGRTL